MGTAGIPIQADSVLSGVASCCSSLLLLTPYSLSLVLGDGATAGCLTTLHLVLVAYSLSGVHHPIADPATILTFRAICPLLLIPVIVYLFRVFDDFSLNQVDFLAPIKIEHSCLKGTPSFVPRRDARPRIHPG